MNDMNGNFPWNNGPVHLFSTKAPKLSKKLIIDENLRNMPVLEGVSLYYNLFTYERLKQIKIIYSTLKNYNLISFI